MPVSREFRRAVEQVTGQSTGARVYNNANIPVPTGTTFILSFNSQRWNDGGMYSSALPDRLTCQAAGKYAIIGNVRAIVATGNWALQVNKNGTDIIGMAVGPPYPAIGQRMIVSTIADLQAGDYLQVRFWQNTGATVNVEVGAQYSPEFMAQKL